MNWKQNKKKSGKITQINSHLSDSLSSCEVAAEALCYQFHFFHDIPKLSQIRSINWLYTHTVYQLTVWRL